MRREVSQAVWWLVHGELPRTLRLHATQTNAAIPCVWALVQVSELLSAIRLLPRVAMTRRKSNASGGRRVKVT